MDLYDLRFVVSAKECTTGHTWREIERILPYSKHTCRVAYYKKGANVVPGPCPICYGPKDKPEVFFDVSGNYAVATSIDGRIRTLPDLLAACKADLSVWKVRDRDGWEAKAWEGYAADEKKNLTFDEGRITGTVLRDGIITETLWSVRATFVRLNPVPVKPVVGPVACDVSFSAPPATSSTEGTAAILADPHYGYSWKPPGWKLKPLHDRRVLDLFLQVCAELQPDVIELLGDWFDMAAFQDRFVRRSEFYQTTQPAILEGHWWLRSLRETCPQADIRLHMGNHDQRIETAMVNHLREACDLRAADDVDLPPSMSVPRLLALHELGIRWVGDYPDDVTRLGDAVDCQHGAVARGIDLSTVTALLRNGGGRHQVCGHIHRDEMASELVDGGRTVTGYCPGCACHVDGRVPKGTSKVKWRKGFGFVTWSGRHVGIEHVPVWDGKAVCRGKVYQARDVRPDLTAAFSDWPW